MNYRKLRRSIIDKYWDETNDHINSKVDRICYKLSKKINTCQNNKIDSLSKMYLYTYM